MYRSNIGRNFRNDRKNHGRNFRNTRRNHENKYGTNKGNEEQTNTISELWEEINEAFIKGLYILEEKLDDSKIGKSKLVMEFDSTN